MKLLATLAALVALAIVPTAASAQILPGTMGVTTAEPNQIIAILIGFTPPIGSNKGSFAGTGWGLDEMERNGLTAPRP